MSTEFLKPDEGAEAESLDEFVNDNEGQVGPSIINDEEDCGCEEDTAVFLQSHGCTITVEATCEEGASVCPSEVVTMVGNCPPDVGCRDCGEEVEASGTFVQVVKHLSRIYRRIR